MLFHAFQSSKDDSQYAAVDRDEVRLKQVFDQVSVILPDPDTVAVGTVDADDVDRAMDYVIAGEWDYSQKL